MVKTLRGRGEILQGEKLKHNTGTINVGRFYN